MASNSVLTAILAVFTAILDWFGEALATVSTIFYAEGSLTLVGTCAVIGLAIAIFTLVFAMIRSLIKSRG